MTYKITIVGDILAVDYCSTSLITEEDDFLSQYYLICALDKVNEMHINDDEENVIKKKGKYVISHEFLHGLFGEGTEHPFPIEVHARMYRNQEINYEIELEDGEEFDIKKVQLIKSIELPTDTIPYFIVAGHILYDGKQVYTDETDDYCPEEKMYDTFIIEEFDEERMY